jgi:hypothetical protein
MVREGPVEVRRPTAKTFENNGVGSLGYSSMLDHMPNMQ